MEEFDLKRFAKLAMMKKVYIIVILILSIILGVCYSYFYVTPKFKSKTTLLVAQINEEKSHENVVKQSEITDLSMTSTLLEPYISLVESKKVLKNVIENLKLNIEDEDLAKMITVAEENTAMLSVTVVNENAELAEKIANEVANVFMEQSHEIFSITNVNIIDVAERAETPYNVNHIKDIIIFTMLGIFISCGVVLIFYMLDTTIKEEEDIENEVKMPVLAVIPAANKELEEDKSNNKSTKKRKKKEENEIIILDNNKSPVAEAFRVLRTNVTISKDTRSILVTSSRISEGKSYVAANLAVAIANADKKVLLIDADMRKGRQHNIFNLDNKSGLSNYLSNVTEGDANISEITPYIRITAIPNLHVVTYGTKPLNPSELLSSKKIKELISILNGIYDIVIFDGTPSNIVADSITIAKFVDCKILVTAYKETKLEEVKKLKKKFEQLGLEFNGAVINKYVLSKDEYQSSYYYSEDGNSSEIKLLEAGEIKSQELKFANDLINEVKTDDNNLESESDVKPEEEKREEKNYSNFPSLENSNMSMFEYKIEKIDSEIATMKNILMQMAVNQSQINSKDIELIRQDINGLKDNLNELKENEEIRTLKKEIAEVKDFTESLVNSQKENNEKIKKFIENYYRNKNNKSAE